MTRRRHTSLGLIAVVTTTACAVVGERHLGLWMGLLTAVNMVAFGYYGFDKFRAVRSGWRVPEAVLLGFAVFGGAPGSLLGQIIFRHKTSKTSFKRAFWAIVIIEAAILVALIVGNR